MIVQRLVAALVFVASLGFALDARAEFELGLRTGYGIPFGKATGAARVDLNEGIAGQVPLWLDLGARLDHRYYVGAYLAYGIGILGEPQQDQCDQAQAQAGVDVSCSAYDWRFGAQFQYHIGELQRPHPWVGAGIGYELVGLRVSASQGSQEATVTTGGGGWEFVNLQLGLDIPLTDVLALGPFATFTVAQYDNASLDCSGDCGGISSQDQDVEDKAVHNWLLFGLRATAVF